MLVQYYFVLISCIGFLASLIPGRHRKYAGIVGWTFIVLFLFTELPYYFSLNNFLYPIMAVLSVPFLFITARYLMAEDDRILHLTRAAAVAFLIYAPFEYIPVLGNWLIGIVVGQVTGILDALRFPVMLADWNIITRNSFEIYQDQIEVLRQVSLSAKLGGDKLSISEMVREALDDYLTDKNLKL